MITDDLGLDLEFADLPSLERASKIVVTKDKTIIVEGIDDVTSIESHVGQIRSQL